MCWDVMIEFNTCIGSTAHVVLFITYQSCVWKITWRSCQLTSKKKLCARRWRGLCIGPVFRHWCHAMQPLGNTSSQLFFFFCANFWKAALCTQCHDVTGQMSCEDSDHSSGVWRDCLAGAFPAQWHYLLKMYRYIYLKVFDGVDMIFYFIFFYRSWSLVLCCMWIWVKVQIHNSFKKCFFFCFVFLKVLENEANIWVDLGYWRQYVLKSQQN